MTRSTPFRLVGSVTLAVAAAVVGSLGHPSVAHAQGAPGSAVACLYDQPAFGGAATCVDRETQQRRLSPGENDRASSLRVDDGWALRVCEHVDFGGWCRTFVGDIRRLRLSNNAISSFETLRLRASDPAPTPQPQPGQAVVCLYEDFNYQGEARCVNDETSIAALPPWDDNAVSSFRVNDGWRLTACRDPNFGGWCREFDADEPVLRASNDAISSFRVTRLQAPPPPPPQRVACLFTQPNYGGLAICAEGPERIGNIGPRLNNNVGSVRLAAGWSMVVCDQANMTGFCRRLDLDTPAFGPRLGNNISSYQVFRTADFPPPPPTTPTPPRPRPQPPAPGIVTPGPDGPILNIPGIIGAIAGEACLYQHRDFGGDSVCGRSGSDRSSMPGGLNDAISSLRVPQGLVVTACEHNNFQGRCRRFDQNTNFVGRRFNDVISSYRIDPNF